jgi:type IV secretion system protein VirB4
LPYTTRGDYGWLLDADHDDLQDGPLHTFEQKALLTIPELVEPAMRVITHRVEQRMSTDCPMFGPADEAALTWILPADEQETGGALSLYGKKAKEWLMTRRKEGMSLLFATHSLSQVFESALGPLLIGSCPTRFLLPNPQAMTEALQPIYRKLGCTLADIETVATLRPRRDVYYLSPLGKRRLRLPFPPLILDCIARNTAQDHALMDAVLAREGREGFAAGWFRANGYEEEAHYVEMGGLVGGLVGARE